jgi:hypothetical protein
MHLPDEREKKDAMEIQEERMGISQFPKSVGNLVIRISHQPERRG